MTLASQASAEITLQALYNLLMRLVDLFVGEGALPRLIADGEGERLLARGNLFAAVDIEQRDLVYQ